VSQSLQDLTLQKTLRSPIGCVGVGLHTGLKVALTLNPAPADSGIRFRRHDLAGAELIPATWDRVSDTTMCTTLKADAGDGKIATIEHIMAALAACEIDNALVELSGPEVPIMDGSARPFVFLIECAGVVEQAAPRRWIEIVKPVEVTGHERMARLEPADGFELDCKIRFDHPVIDSQSLRLPFVPESFKSEIAPARTFGFAERVEELWASGLALGGSLKNAVVVSHDRVLNEEGLRFPDEFVRHKLLDSLGDLYLAGAPIRGRFVGRCAGHGLHNKLLRALFEDQSAWRFASESEAPATEPVEVPLRRASGGA
jgi:UDP-3-O-[3-hydroxymyristoyl] N-acetylglucosamine deacetylase